MPELEPIDISTPLSETTENVHEELTFVPPTNIRKSPPAEPTFDEPSKFAPTVCASFVRNPVTASEPSCTP